MTAVRAGPTRDRRRREPGLPAAVLVVLIGGFVLTALLVSAAAASEQAARREAFDRRVAQLDGEISSEIAAAAELLHALRSAYAIDGGLTRGGFERYAEVLDPGARRPGLRALEHAAAVPSDGIDALVEDVHRDPTISPAQRQAFAVKGATDQGIHVVVDAVEPYESNGEVFGLDLRGMPDRREAVDRARDEGRITVTEPVELVQAPGKPGFLVVVPLYATGTTPPTVAERRSEFSGVVAAVFQADLMLAEALRSAPNIDVEIYDVGPTGQLRTGGGGEASLLHGGGVTQVDDERSGQPEMSFIMDVGGRRWSVIAKATPRFEDGNPIFPFVVGVGGGIASVLGAALVAAVGRSRRARRDQVLQSFLEFAPDAVVLVDDTGVIVQVNQQTEALFGYERGELVGEAVEVLLPPELRTGHVRNVEQFVASPSARPMGAGRELLGAKRDGTRFAVDVSLSPISTDSGTLYAAAVRDVTERRRVQRVLEEAAEQLRANNRLKDQFLDITAHELRTPLAAIDGFTEILRTDVDHLDPGRREQLMARIGANVSEMREMVERLLDLSRLNAGRIELDRRRLAVAEEAGWVLQRLQVRVPGRRITLDIDPSLTVVADRTAVRHVLTNLLGNAVKFTDPGTPVTVQATRMGEDVLVEVTDAGPGIADEEQQHLFDRFVQGSAQAPGLRGAGVGLSIVRGYVELHGGRVGVRSRLGRGSTFWFTLPVTPRPGAPTP